MDAETADTDYVSDTFIVNFGMWYEVGMQLHSFGINI